MSVWEDNCEEKIEVCKEDAALKDWDAVTLCPEHPPHCLQCDLHILLPQVTLMWGFLQPGNAQAGFERALEEKELEGSWVDGGSGGIVGLQSWGKLTGHTEAWPTR